MAGRGAGLWGGGRPILKIAYALNTLYSGLGLTPAIYAQSTRETDTNGDGTVDNRTTYTYDANGNRTMLERDSNLDGTADYRETETYDANGNLTIYEEDDLADGTGSTGGCWNHVDCSGPGAA